jgi:hypothetical protein
MSSIRERSSRVMMKTAISLTFAAACLAVIPSAPAQIITNEVVTNAPKASPGDFGDWSPRRNIIESRRYDTLLQTNPAFRAARMRRECGPITDPQLRADCLASFDQYEPFVGSNVGSNTAPRRYRTTPGAGD